MQQATIEEHWLTNDDLRQRVWVVRPTGGDRFPAVVWNHGSQISIGADGGLMDRSDQPQVQGDGAAWRAWASRQRLILVIPEGRGYGGSEGRPPIYYIWHPGTAMTLLASRARDAIAAALWASRRPDVMASRMAIAGASHGGVVSLLASADYAFAGTAIQATGPSYRNRDVGFPKMQEAAARGEGPLLVQHFLTDTLVSIDVSRAIAKAASEAGRECIAREYPGVPGVEGHHIHAPVNRQQWIPEFNAFMRRCLANPQ